MTEYFSDREPGPRARTKLEIEAPAWGGIVALVSRYVSNGGFGVDFPEDCPDGRGPVGTDSRTLGLAVRAEVPGIEWLPRADQLPRTPNILDFLEFCHEHVSDPIEGEFHRFFGHSHLAFDRDKGKVDFRAYVNRIFSRSGLAYTMEDTGRFTRLAAPVLDEELRAAVFETGDDTLDQLLEAARAKFLNPDPDSRREALEKLWDAWERLKTLEPGKNKRASAAALLDKTATEPTLRKVLEDEATALTNIGNTFRIRHSETTQVELAGDNHVDYLFHRALSLIQLCLRAR